MSEANILAKKLIALLREKQLHITCAESCTGGGIAYYLTSVDHASKVFDYGFVTYSNSAKQDLLSVDKDTLDSYGAVSLETVSSMCAGAINKSKADIAIAVSGVAGPGGGTEDKPVGTVCIGWQIAEKIITKKFKFDGDRNQIRIKTIETALSHLIDLIK